jgi:hypothetical protein
MGQPALTIKAFKDKTLAPTDICLIPGPLGIPTPAPFPGEDVPMAFVSFCDKVLIESMPSITVNSKEPLSKPHGGPLGACGPGMPMGLGKLMNVTPLAFKVKWAGQLACAEGALYMHNGGNSPPAKAEKGCPKVKIS